MALYLLRPVGTPVSIQQSHSDIRRTMKVPRRDARSKPAGLPIYLTDGSRIPQIPKLLMASGSRGFLND